MNRKTIITGAAVLVAVLAGALVVWVRRGASTEPGRPAERERAQPAAGQDSQPQGEGQESPATAEAAPLDGTDVSALMSQAEMNLRKAQWLKALAFPAEYNGTPSENAPAEMRDKIIAVHKRFWKNYTRLIGVSADFSMHTFIDGKPDPKAGGGWDMDVHMEFKPGQGFTLKGVDGKGQPVETTVSAEGEAARRSGNWLSFMRHISQMRYAYPEICSMFERVEENVPMGEGAEGPRYDVLIAQGSRNISDRKLGLIPVKYWFNTQTAMLEKIERCEPEVMEKYGRYYTQTFAYTSKDGVFFLTEYIEDCPFKGVRIVERNTNVSLQTVPD